MSFMTEFSITKIAVSLHRAKSYSEKLSFMTLFSSSHFHAGIVGFFPKIKERF